jgi:ribosomal protein S19
MSHRKLKTFSPPPSSRRRKVLKDNKSRKTPIFPQTFRSALKLYNGTSHTWLAKNMDEKAKRKKISKVAL